MFKRVINDAIADVVFDFEGAKITARSGESVAAALLADAAAAP